MKKCNFCKRLNAHAEPKTLAGIAVFLLSLVIVTPLCGLLFACGCSWPWSGFVSACNYYHTVAGHRCPWCASQIAGWLSVSLAIAAGVSTALLARFNAKFASAAECLVRISLGIFVFTIIAVFGAWAALKLQGYPLGLLV
jgi:uncharacterized membrane protein